jgi:hypothetical protein
VGRFASLRITFCGLALGLFTNEFKNNQMKPQNLKEAIIKAGATPVVTCWLDFGKQEPTEGQNIYVLDVYGDIQPAIYRTGQTEYWTRYKYLWSGRPACR